MKTRTIQIKQLEQTIYLNTIRTFCKSYNTMKNKIRNNQSIKSNPKYLYTSGNRKQNVIEPIELILEALPLYNISL